MYSQKPWWCFLFKNSHIVDEIERYLKNKPKPIINREENTNMLLGYLSNLKSKNPLVSSKTDDITDNTSESTKKIVIKDLDVEELVEKISKKSQLKREEKNKSIQKFFDSKKKIEKTVKIAPSVEKTSIVIIEKEKNNDTIDTEKSIQTTKEIHEIKETKSLKKPQIINETKSLERNVQNVKTNRTNVNLRLIDSLEKIKNQDEDLDNNINQIIAQLEKTKDKIDSFAYIGDDDLTNDSDEIFQSHAVKPIILNHNSLNDNIKHNSTNGQNKVEEPNIKKDLGK